MNLDDISRGRYFIFKEHPAFILTDPFIPKGQTQKKVICVNASSVRNWRGKKRTIDKTCVLKKDDHYSIRHDSYIYYKDAASYPINHSMFEELPLAMQSQGQDAFLTPAILIKICKGLMQSPLARDDVKDHYRQAVEQKRAYPVV